MAISILNGQFIRHNNGTSFPRLRPEISSNSGKNFQKNNQHLDNEENWWPRWRENNGIHLSKQSLLDYSNEDSLTKAVFFAHGQLHKVVSDAEKYLKHHTGDDYSSHVINSLVISASLGHGRHIQLPSPVRITLGHLKSNYTDPVCVFWDYESSGWSDNGCRHIANDNRNEDVSICECDHLTNFALLMRPAYVDRATGASLSKGGSTMNPSTVKVLEIVTYVAVGLSLVFLVVIIYRYHSEIHRLMLEYNCMASGNKGKKQDKPMDGCAKSQSFYSGMNQLVQVQSANNSTSTVTTTASPCNSKQPDPNRVRITNQIPYYNCCSLGCHHQQVSCSNSPSSSVASSAHLCPVPIHTIRPTMAHLHPTRWHHTNTHQWVHPPPIELSQYIARQEFNRAYPSLGQCRVVDQDVEDDVSNYQPYLSLSTPVGHIINNPYDMRHDAVSPPDGLLATQHLRDAVYMSSQLVNLTNTLRASNNKKKMVCQGGHSTAAGPCHHSRRESIQEDGDMVFRAVSPHGHVYWEIGPSRSDKLKVDSPHPQQQEIHLTSMSRQSSSRYSDNYPLITGSPAKSDNPTHEGGNAETTILVNPFADVQLISLNNGSSPVQARPNDVRFSSLRGTQKHQRHMVTTPVAHNYQHFGTRASSARIARMRDVVNTVEQWRAAQAAAGSTEQTGSSSLSSSDGSSAMMTSASSSSTSPTCQQNFMDQVQMQVQIKDLRSIPASVKSTDYILAKIQNQLGRSTPLNNTVLNRSSPKQRKV